MRLMDGVVSSWRLKVPRYRRLTEGEMVRDKDTGERYRVGRVTPGAASLHSATAELAEPVLIPERWVKGKLVPARSFTPAYTGRVVQVSPNASMIHEEDEEPVTISLELEA